MHSSAGTETFAEHVYISKCEWKYNNAEDNQIDGYRRLGRLLGWLLIFMYIIYVNII